MEEIPLWSLPTTDIIMDWASITTPLNRKRTTKKIRRKTRSISEKKQAIQFSTLQVFIHVYFSIHLCYCYCNKISIFEIQQTILEAILSTLLRTSLWHHFFASKRFSVVHNCNDSMSDEPLNTSKKYGTL